VVPYARHLILGDLDGYWVGPTLNIQFDAGAYFFHPDNPFVGPQALSNGVNARRARFGFVGGTPGGWSFGFVYDAGNSQDTTPRGIETLQLVYGGIKGVAVEIGYSDAYFTLDQSTRSRDLMFLERSSASNIANNFNTGDFRANAGVRFFSDRYWAGAYLTGPAANDSHTQTAERFGAFERATVQALQGKQHSLHLGVGFDQLIQPPNNGNGTPDSLTLSDQPELRIDPTVFLNTGAMGTKAHPTTGGFVYDLETAATYRGLMWQGEYYRYLVNRAGLPNASFSGWYAQIAWTVTGETHGYNEQGGSYFRIIPAHPFDLAANQWGAWEIAARIDNVELNSHFTPGVALSADPAAVDGGIQRGLTVGLNWYPNDYIRFLLDYIHIDYDKENGVKVTGAPLGVPVGMEFDAVALRSQVAF
jgi:phosphate-selective porin OprO/OprP